MTDVLPEETPPIRLVDAPDIAERELARKNMLWGWALFGLFCVLFGGTVGVALVYLWLD
ncbi:MAG: hypothetical protein QOH16_1261 [Gaiellaceae bacterium]|jgi:hypothetical protein|nr:hypothetical protein [Gaiellaceae bacterium]